MDINSAVLVGRLTRDAELAYLPNGTALLSFCVAVNHTKKKDGSHDSSFIECKCFGKLGEALKQYMERGKQVSVKGFLKQERWEKNDQKFSRIILNCEEIQLIGNNSTGSIADNNGYSEDVGYGK